MVAQNGIVCCAFDRQAVKIPDHAGKYTVNKIDSSTRLQRNVNTTFQVVADEAILIHLNSGTYFSLNKVGTEFWQILDGEQTIQDHAATLAAKYNRRRRWWPPTCWNWPKKWRRIIWWIRCDPTLSPVAGDPHIAGLAF